MKSIKKCCPTVPVSLARRGSDHAPLKGRVNRIKGQVEGIGRMIDERAYCPDIITQIQAVRSALGSLQALVLQGHLEHCVRNSMSSRTAGGADELVSELMGIFRRGN